MLMKINDISAIKCLIKRVRSRGVKHRIAVEEILRSKGFELWANTKRLDGALNFDEQIWAFDRGTPNGQVMLLVNWIDGVIWVYNKVERFDMVQGVNNVDELKDRNKLRKELLISTEQFLMRLEDDLNKLKNHINRIKRDVSDWAETTNIISDDATLDHLEQAQKELREGKFKEITKGELNVK